MASDYSDYKALDLSLTRSDREYDEIFVDRRAINDPAVVGFNYLFFTSPDLALTANKFLGGNTGVLFSNNAKYLKLPNSGDSIYTNDMISTLTGEKSMFMNVLTNRACGSPGSDIVMDTLDYSETWNKYKIPIGTSQKDSKIAGSFEIPYREDQNLTVMKLHHLWMEYIDGLFLGNVISGYAAAQNMGDTQSAVIDYMSSLYHFAVRPDGRTLVYWAKYTGVFPNKNPYGQFQSEDNNLKLLDEINIGYQFAYKEDMEIGILRDFNLISQANKSNLTNYTGSFFHENSVNVGNTDSYPCIKKVNQDKSGMTYQLRFQETNDPATEGGKRLN